MNTHDMISTEHEYDMIFHDTDSITNNDKHIMTMINSSSVKEKQKTKKQDKTKQSIFN